MWQSSPTFRQQLHRLAAGAALRVRVLVEDRRSLSFNARTVLTHQHHSLALAEVYLKPSLDAAELIAHEMEHIVEQLDGVDLEAQAGNGAVWSSGGHRTFETRRAIEVGRRVARETTMGSDVPDVRNRASENNTDRLTTVVQQDRHAAPSSVRSARVSGNGRYVVFVSAARLVEADSNQFGDIYVLDLATGHCTLESLGPGGSPSTGESLSPDISRDGRYVVFESAASNLTDTQLLPGIFRVFLRDREKGATRLLPANMNSASANGSSGNPAINAGGTAVVFESTATDLIAGENARNSVGVYLIQLTSGLHTRLDVTSAGQRPAGSSACPAISADGRFVVFMSKADLTCRRASACVAESSDKNGVPDIYLRDTHTNTTRRITRSYTGGDPDGPSYHPAISGDGRHVAFVSEASNLTRDSGNRAAHIYVHDLLTGITELISHTPNGRPANGASLRPALSHNGSTIAFQSLASDLLCEGKCQGGERDINLLWDVFVYDQSARRTTRVSTDMGEEWMENSRAPSLDDTGHVLAFGSKHPINGGDDDRDEDLYVYRLR